MRYTTPASLISAFIPSDKFSDILLIFIPSGSNKHFGFAQVDMFLYLCSGLLFDEISLSCHMMTSSRHD